MKTKLLLLFDISNVTHFWWLRRATLGWRSAGTLKKIVIKNYNNKEQKNNSVKCCVSILHSNEAQENNSRTLCHSEYKNYIFLYVLNQCLFYSFVYSFIHVFFYPVDYRHSETGSTTLMVAASRGFLTQMEQLLHMGAGVKIKASNGW